MSIEKNSIVADVIPVEVILNQFQLRPFTFLPKHRIHASESFYDYVKTVPTWKSLMI